MLLLRRLAVWPRWLTSACLLAASFAAATACGATPEVPQWIHRLPEIVASLPVPGDRGLPEDNLPAEEVTYPDTARLQSSRTQSASARAEEIWHEPQALIENLSGLTGSGPTSKWATEVLRQVRALGPAVLARSKSSTAILQRLAALDREVPELAARIPDGALAHRLRKVGFALRRRIEVWQQVVEMRLHPANGKAAPALDAKRLEKCLAEIEAVTGESAEGRAWREFLMVDALKQCAARGEKGNSPQTPKGTVLFLADARTRDTARRALVRLMQTSLAADQQRFIASGPVTALRTELWRWAAEPVAAGTLLRHIERYEQTRLPSDARRLALDCQNLLASSVEAERQLADRVDLHYRNANVRVAVTEKLINDLIPERNLEYSQVNDRVLGRPVAGESLMATELAVRMLPDPKHVRLALQVKGEIEALTTVNAGMAQIHNESKSYYDARKPLEIDIDGIRLFPVEIEVRNDSRVRGVGTPLSRIPVLGAIADGAARAGADQSKAAADAEVKQKVADQARERIDRETRQQLSGVVDKLNQRFFDPVNNLLLDPQMIDGMTDEKRFTMRLRLGGEDQLGSHTPRPEAPGDSLASLQIHESMLNNGIQRLQLAGRTFTLPELSKHVAELLNCPAPWPTNPENDDVKITFAARDPIVVRCQDGQLVITLSIAQLSKPPRKWTNFQIRAFYQPAVNGRSAELVREGVIHLMGPRLTAGSQFALRGIFSHAFSKKVPWVLTPERFLKEQKLKDTAITQFVIEDGWIGLALGPKPAVPMTARRPHRGVQ
jgi:hypothetical protein